ncbi:PQQ-binding-like beta-propeller repeat protein [Kribbella sp. C-35]|uniref:outer membrane protein assembly factor BamB family protein n=1 Tax=Kribbella sp. C-35 TaxID=2789276 RepID=UPI003977F5E0
MKRKKIIALAVLPALAFGSWGVVEGVQWWGERCQPLVARVPAEQPLPSLRPAAPAEVDLSAFSDSLRVFAEEVLAQARRMPSSLGTLRSVVTTVDKYGAPNGLIRLVGAEQGEPLVLIDQDQLAGKQEVSAGVVTRLDSAIGGTAWARWYDDHLLDAAHTSKGLVLHQHEPDGLAPQIASVEPGSGELQWCTSIGEGYVSGSNEPSIAAGGGGLFALRGANDKWSDQRPILVSLDPGNGKRRWKARIDGFEEGGSVDVFGDSVLVTQWGDRADRFSVPSNGDGRLRTNEGPVRAFAIRDGSAKWEYPGPDGTGWATAVIGVHDSTAVVLARQTRGSSPTYDRRNNQNWLVGLGPDGKERWRQDLGNRIGISREDGVRVVGDVLLTFETTGIAPRDQQTVVARDVSTGKTRWTKTFTDYTKELDPREVAVAGNTLLIATLHDLVGIDLTTGTMRSLLTDNQLDAEFNVAVDDRSLVVNAAGLILTFDRKPN